jgi:hypothetical protein
MTTAATINTKLTLNDKQFQKGMGQAEKAASNVANKLRQLDGYLKRNAATIELFGEGMQKAGKKMTMFISVPIIGFFGMIIKKALEADTAMSKLAKESTGRLNASLAQLGEKFLPLFIQIVDGLTNIINKFLEASPATQKFITTLIALAAMAGPLLTFTGSLISTVSWLGQVGITASSIMPALTTLFTFITATAIPAIVAFIAANAAWIVPLLLVAATVYLVYKAFKTNFGGIATTAKQLGAIIKIVFVNGIGKAIDWVISKIERLRQALANIKLPDALTPGSPTPFEMGLRGIASAMDNLSNKSMPKMSVGMNNAPPSVREAGGGRGNVSYVDNRKFGGGMSAQELRVALDSRMAEIAGAL